MPKATPTVAEFLASLPDDRRAAMTTVHKAIRKTIPKHVPYVTAGMGTPIIGYGKYHYRSASGREGDWFLIGLAAGKNYFSLHICAADDKGYLTERNATNLGKVKTGRSCINFKKPEDLNLTAAMKLVKLAAKVGGMNAVK
jgi:Domain of unknown function (DU1801)